MGRGPRSSDEHQPERPARRELGAVLRRTRRAIGRTTRQVPGFTTGHVSEVERGKVTPSWDLVQVYVDEFGGDPALLRQLYQRMQDEVAVHRTRQRHVSHPASAQSTTPPQRVDEDTTHEQIRQHYTIEHRAEHYVLAATGVVTEVRCQNSIRATSPGVALFVARHTYDNDRRPQVLQVGAEHGCCLETVRTYSTGGVEAYFRLDRRLGPDSGTYRLAHRVFVTSNERAHPRLIFHAPAGLRGFDLSARFEAPALPRELWWFEAFGTIDAELPRHRLQLESDGSCHRSFRAPAAGWYYGIAWNW